MPISELYELDGVSITTSELSIVSGTTSLQTISTDGIIQLYVDPDTTLSKSERFIVRIYETVEATGGTKRVVFSATIPGPHVGEAWTFPPLILMHGWDMTLQKLEGSNVNFDASIRAVTGSAISEPHELDGVTVGSSELSVPSGTTSLSARTEAGIYQCFFDPVGAALAKGDSFFLQIKEKVEATGGIQQVVWSAVIDDAQSENLVSPMLLLMNGWDVTITKLAGTDRAWDASVRKVG